MIGMLTGLLTNLLWGLPDRPDVPHLHPSRWSSVTVTAVGWRRQVGCALPKVVVSGVIITLAVTVVAVPLRTALFGGVTGGGADLFVARMHSMGQNLGGVGGDYGDRRKPGR